MKKIFIAVLLFVMYTASFSNNALAYFDTIDHYSFDLPADWKQIPKSVIDNQMSTMVKQTGGQRVEFVSGFQLAKNEYFEYPYILIQKHAINTPSFSEIEKTFSSSDFQKLVDQKTEEYSKLLNSATADKPFIDTKRNIIFMNIKLNVANIGQVNGLIAMFPGKNCITQLNFYSTEKEYTKWIPVFNSIIDSFKYENDYAYNPIESVKNDSPSILNKVIEKGIVGAVTGGGIMIFVSLMGVIFRKKKNEKEIDNNVEKVKYCIKCGNKINSAATICNKCGKEVN